MGERGGDPAPHAALYRPRRGGDPAPHTALYRPRWGEIRLHTPPSTDQGGERSGSTRRPLQTEVRRKSRTWERGEEIRLHTPPSTPRLPWESADFEFSIAANIFATDASACNMTPSLLVSATYPECFDRSL